MIRCLHLSNSRQSQIKITEVWQHSLTVLSRCTRKIDVWILCVTIAKTFDAIVVSKALWPCIKFSNVSKKRVFLIGTVYQLLRFFALHISHCEISIRNASWRTGLDYNSTFLCRQSILTFNITPFLTWCNLPRPNLIIGSSKAMYLHTRYFWNMLYLQFPKMKQLLIKMAFFKRDWQTLKVLKRPWSSGS